MSQCRKSHKKINSKQNDLFQDITNCLVHMTAGDMIVFDESQL